MRTVNICIKKGWRGEKERERERERCEFAKRVYEPHCVRAIEWEADKRKSGGRENKERITDRNGEIPCQSARVEGFSAP